MNGWMDGWIGGWMDSRMDEWDCYFISFLTVFQSYQGDGRVIMEGYVQQNLLQLERFLPLAGLEPGTARSAGQHLTY